MNERKGAREHRVPLRTLKQGLMVLNQNLESRIQELRLEANWDIDAIYKTTFEL